jgi:hypothetical protein
MFHVEPDTPIHLCFLPGSLLSTVLFKTIKAIAYCSLLQKPLYLCLANLIPMVATSSNKPKLPFSGLPRKSVQGIMKDFIIPGIDIISFRTYQFRTKAWRVKGYNSSRNTTNRLGRKRREYRLNINGFKAWKIGFKNRLQVPVDITLHFTMRTKDGFEYDYTEVCKNIQPGKEAEIAIIPGLKTVQVRLDTVEVNAGSNLLSRTEVNSFMPFSEWSFAFSFFIACIIGVSFLFISLYRKEVTESNDAAKWVSILGFYLAFWEAFNITPVIIMFLLLLSSSFILYNPLHIVGLLVLGCFYLVAVWRKRSSIKDFLIGAFVF